MDERQSDGDNLSKGKPRASINVDIGGTFTDCVILSGEQMAFGK